MDLIMIEEKLNKDCLDNIYSFIKLSKEEQTAINFNLFLKDQVNSFVSNKIDSLKIGCYYIDINVLEDKAYPSYFKVKKITNAI